MAPNTGSPLRIARDGRPDNIHWSPDGTLLVAILRWPAKRIFAFAATSGDVSPAPFRIMEIDPRAMKPLRTLVDERAGGRYSGGTAALEVGDELWVSSSRNIRIARYRR